MKHSEKVLKASIVLVLSSFMMGATNCEQPVANSRELKKNIKILDVSASSFLDNSGFSFSEVARSQYSGVIFEKNHFYERNVYLSI